MSVHIVLYKDHTMCIFKTPQSKKAHQVEARIFEVLNGFTTLVDLTDWIGEGFPHNDVFRELGVYP